MGLLYTDAPYYLSKIQIFLSSEAHLPTVGDKGLWTWARTKKFQRSLWEYHQFNNNNVISVPEKSSFLWSSSFAPQPASGALSSFFHWHTITCYGLLCMFYGLLCMSSLGNCSFLLSAVFLIVSNIFHVFENSSFQLHTLTLPSLAENSASKSMNEMTEGTLYGLPPIKDLVVTALCQDCQGKTNNLPRQLSL